MGAKKAFKTYSMSTTIREIERIPDLMNTIIRLEKENLNFIGCRLDKISKEKYVSEIIKDGFVTSPKVDQFILNKINDKVILSDREVAKFMDQAIQRPGWSGRLSNYLNKTESLGFSYRMNNHVMTTKLGNFFVSYPIEAVQWSLINIPVNNPLKRNLNSFTIMGNIANYLKHYKKRTISKENLAVLLSLHSGDDVFNNKLFNNDICEAVKLSPSLSENTIYDYVDEMIRTLMFSGFFTREFNGIRATDFLLSKIDEILNVSYKKIEEFKTINTIEEMISLIDSFSFEETIENNKLDISNQLKIKSLSSEFSYDELKGYINQVMNREIPSIKKINQINYQINSGIKRFVWMEWLVALMLTKNNDFIITPNLSLDNFGFPISHAGAGKPDIEMNHNGKISTIEVTLISNRTQLLNSETTNLVRNLKSINGTSIFLIAPKIHEDVKLFFDYVSKTQNIQIKGIPIIDFINKFPLIALDKI